MASISKRRYWVNPQTGKEVLRETPGAVQRESRFFRIRYTNAAGKLVSVRGFVDLCATRHLAAQLQTEASRASADDDVILSQVVAAWPFLSEAARIAIAKLAVGTANAQR
jgi:hypothetical protein